MRPSSYCGMRYLLPFGLALMYVGCSTLSDTDREALNRWVDQLDSSSIDEREDAARRLLGLGPPALPFLDRIPEHSLTPEARLRLRDVVDLLRVKAYLQIRPLHSGERWWSNQVTTWIMEFAYEMDAEFEGLGDFRFEMEDALDERGRRVPLNRWFNMINLPVKPHPEEIAERFATNLYMPDRESEDAPCVVEMRGKLSFVGRNGPRELPWSIGGFRLVCR